ncbi:hypothetical protein Pcinc_033528 [Petrolisthes cinctipes]|uniref:ZP domain-containing protein n=1 Tax=Petrolisthes cinctipes TaxID=88211 RepID=A0AAE1JX83_PETCI|nr:hypothetical protein Pcinc_033528 [Petrolisthes cinctipes]
MTLSEYYINKFSVPIEGCGTTGQLEAATRTQDMYFENTIIIQTDPIIQEEWDVARNIRCTWAHTFSKSVVATPFKVYEPEKVPVRLDARSIDTLMVIQEGEGPFAGPATGYVHMGDDISVVIYVQDPTHEMDANVVSCNASSAGGRQVALVDERGCRVRPELLTPFAKTRTTNGVDADLMLYSYLKAFNIGESPEFLISCHLEVCEGKCSEPCPFGTHSRVRRQEPSPSPSHPRSAMVELQRGVVVVAREPVIGGGEVCWLDGWVLVTGVVLVTVVGLLSTLSCVLALKLTSLRQQLQHKQLH